MHASVPMVCAGVAYLLIASGSNFSLSLALLVSGGGIFFSYYPIFWSIPTMVLSETAAAASFGMINSIGRIGGLSDLMLSAGSTTGLAGTVLALISTPSPGDVKRRESFA